MNAAGVFLPLSHREKGAAAQTPRGEARRYTVRICRAGPTRGPGGEPGGVELGAAALQQAAASRCFHGCAVFVDHTPERPSPSLHNLCGVVEDAWWDEAQSAVLGVVRIYPFAAAVAALLDALLADPACAPDVGLSMVFWPEYAPGLGRARRVSGIRSVESVDLVFAPAADGRVLQALAALPAHPPSISALSSKKEKLMTTANPTPEISDADAAGLIAASGLPAAARQRLAALPYASPAEAQAAIDAERGYLARLAQDQVVQIGGQAPRGGSLQVGRSALEQVQAAAEALFMGVRPAGAAPLSGIRELYLLLSGDYEMSGVFQPERVHLANVTSATMAGLVANALNKVVVNEYMKYPQWWSPFTLEMDFTTLQDVRWITLGGVGALPSVAEGAAYTELTWDDQTETAAFVKKGGYLGLTLEAIDKDETAKLRAAPRAMAQAAWLTLGKAVAGIFTAASGAGPTLSDGAALFHATHGNLGNSALSLSSYNAVRTAMRKQAELNSGERLGALCAPRYLLVPPDLETTALQVLASSYDYGYAVSNAPAAPENVFAEGEGRLARLEAARRRVIVVDLWTDANDWAAVADPQLYPAIGIGYRFGRAPEVFSAASPTAGLMFTNDVLPVKARFFFAAGPVDYRGVYKMNV